MVKRAADKQLTDRNYEDPDTDDPPTNGPTLASPQVISKRQIRALPKKAGGAPLPTGISAFGAIPSLTPGWTPPSIASQSGVSVPRAPLFGALSNFTSGQQAKTTIFGSPSAMPLSSSSTLPKPNAPSNSLALTKCFAALRGLNTSVLRAFEDLMNKDAFQNLSSSFDHIKAKYDQHRRQIESELEKASSSLHNETQSSRVAEPPVVAPSSTSNGSSKSSPANSSPTDTSLLKPDLKASNDGNKINGSASSGTTTAQAPKANSRPGAFTMAAPARPSPLRYESENAPTGSPPPQPEQAGKENPTSLDSSTDPIQSESSLPSNPNPTHEEPPSKKSIISDPSTPAPSIFGNLSAKTNSLFGNSATNNGSSSVFGSSGTSKPFSFTSLATASPTPSSKPASIGFGFGVSAAATTNPFGGFGSSKSSTTQATPPKNGFNPVGFSFGNSPPPSTSFQAKTSDSAPTEKEATTASSIGTPASTANENKPPSGPAESEGSNSLTTADSNKGEEEEETLFETTGRVYALIDKKQEDGRIQKSWVGWAICNVKLNQHKQTQRSRILARSQVNQNILINFLVSPHLKPENRGNSLEMVGFNPEGTQLQAYRIRPTSTEAIEEFSNAIKKVVEKLSKPPS